jgi:hypothetical protein
MLVSLIKDDGVCETRGLYIEATKLLLTEVFPKHYKNTSQYKETSLWISLSDPNGEGHLDLKGNDWILSLPNDKDPLTVISFIAHEIIHLKQYMIGELVDLEGEGIRWKGNIFLDFETEYEYTSLPWEVEAFSREKVLLKQCIDLLIEGYIYGHESLNEDSTSF